jgi:hypothetical protein
MMQKRIVRSPLACGLTVATAILVLAVTCGCRDSGPRRVAVHGKVTYHGKPVPSGSLCFSRINSSGSDTLTRPATGELTPDGSYTMQTFGKNDGVLPGEYAVTIVAVDYSRAADVSRSGGKPMSKQEIQSQLLVPLKYGARETSGLKATVPADATGPLTFDFDLKD